MCVCGCLFECEGRRWYVFDYMYVHCKWMGKDLKQGVLYTCSQVNHFYNTLFN